MKLKKLAAAILAGMFAIGSFGTTQAATRAEIAAIKVETASDFKYWNDDSQIKQKIINFVEDVTNPYSPNFIPVEDRIATFDMDGTFYCETAPLYFQETMFFYRVLEDKNYQAPKKIVKFAEKIKPKIYNKTGITPAENKILVQQLTKAYEGMTSEEYRAYVRKFMETNETGLTNLKRGEAFYLPMVEVISYLSNNGFAVYIDSACGVDTTRELVAGVIPIQYDRIIASDFVYTSTKMGKDKPDGHFYDRYKEKIVISGETLIDNGKTRKIFSILNHIGKKPVLAFGNSMGDSGMLEYTLQNNKYRSEAFYVLCDDTERELGNLERAKKDKATADKRGWNTISMRNDWKTIYGDNVKVER
jgi:FMN phosphatase YigB (HAD superfamily)